MNALNFLTSKRYFQVSLRHLLKEHALFHDVDQNPGIKVSAETSSEKSIK